MRQDRPVRERLLDAADSLLFIEGAIATPVDAILKQAGASPPSLYTHFGNKEGLIAAALRRRLRIWVAEWDAAISVATTDRARVLALWDALRTYQSERLPERWCAFSGTAAAILEPGPDLQAVLDEETSLLRNRLRQYAEPLASGRGDALASRLMVAYAGTMAMMLREPYYKAIDEGRSLAEALLLSR